MAAKAAAQRSSTVFPAEEPRFCRFSSRRSVVHSTKGIVACSQPLAARAGIKILQDGGNAADAAVATAAALNMTEPTSTGIGGDMFCLFYNAETKKTHALNGSGRTGAKMSREQVIKDLGRTEAEPGDMPFRGVQSITVPGAPAGWVDCVERFGGGKVNLSQILQPAIDLGEEGFPVSELTSTFWQNGEQLIKEASPNFFEMLKADSKADKGCRAPQAGELFSNKNLAQTFRALAKDGKKGFYEGRIAESLIKVVQDLGGQLTLDDLKKHGQDGSESVDPVSYKFSGQKIAEPVELWEHPPNGQGLIALLALGIFDEMEKAGKIKQFEQKDHNSVEYLHAIIEALRLAFSDGKWFVGDPNVTDVPVAALLEPSYLASRAALFSSDSANPEILRGSPALRSSDTVYLSVTDPAGNACSFINSNYAGFGTGIVPAGCGFTLQNRGANFVLDPADHPNVLAPGKRPFHTIIPALVTRQADASLHSCFGVMGAFMQPQGHLQVLLNMLVFGLDPQAALDAPRICIEAASKLGRSAAAEDEVYLEEGIPAAVAEGLKAKGHNVFFLDGYAREKFGRGQVIRRHVEDGVQIYSAGSDLRGDGHASPL